MSDLVEYFSSLPLLIQQSIKELFIITVFDKYFITKIIITLSFQTKSIMANVKRQHIFI